MGIGDWGLGIGDWGLGIGPNPQSPLFFTTYDIIIFKFKNKILKINLYKFVNFLKRNLLEIK